MYYTPRNSFLRKLGEVESLAEKYVNFSANDIAFSLTPRTKLDEVLRDLLTTLDLVSKIEAELDRAAEDSYVQGYDDGFDTANSKQRK